MKEYQNNLRILIPNPSIFFFLLDAIFIVILKYILPLPEKAYEFLLLFVPSLITCVIQFISMALIFKYCGGLIKKGTKTTLHDIVEYYLVVLGNMILFVWIAHATTWIVPSLNDFRINDFNFSGTIIDYILFLIISSAIIDFLLLTVSMILYQIIKRKVLSWDDLNRISF